MALATLLASLLFGLLVLAVVALVVSGREWRDYSLSLASRADSRSSMARLASDPRVWTIAFLLVVLGVGGAALAVVTDVAGLAGVALPVLGGVSGALVALFLLYGTFATARARGLHRAQAAAVVSWVIALVGVALVVGRLLELL